MSTLLREHTAMPWRNGGGTTYEVARHPADGEADWRVSFADVVEPGPFSAFPGVDRVITLVDGERIDLVVDGETHALLPYAPFCFAGEAQVTSTPAGPTRDLNLMTRRGVCTGTVECVRLDGALTVEAVGDRGVLLLAVLDGAFTAVAGEDEHHLEPADVLALDADERAVGLAGTGVVAVLRVEPTRS